MNCADCKKCEPLKNVQADFHKKIIELGSQIPVSQEKKVICDGVLNMCLYSRLPVKLMWVLKEAPVGNDVLYDDVWSFDCKDARPAFKNVVQSFPSLKIKAKLSYELLKRYLNPQSKDYMCFADKMPPTLSLDGISGNDEIEKILWCRAFCSVAHINVGKNPSATSTPWQELDRCADRWGKIDAKQILEYDADIVFFSGTFDVMNSHGLLDAFQLHQIPIEKLITVPRNCNTMSTVCLFEARGINNHKKLFVRCYHTGYTRISGGLYSYFEDVLEIVRNAALQAELPI